MEWQDLLVDGFGRIPDLLEHVLKGLPQEDLEWMPKPDSNSIGWLSWHATRGEDSQIASLMGEEQLWIKDGWHEKFNRKADPGDTGFGHKVKDLAAFKPPEASILIAYQRAVTKRSQGYIRSLSKSDLDRVLNEPWFKPLPTVGVRLISIMVDSAEHAGQAGYVRGLRQGLGWQKY